MRKGARKRGGTCAAATDSRLDGVHGGINAGRACWVVAGTMCDCVPATGSFARKMESCIECRFYRMVKEEEPEFVDHWTLLLRAR